MRLPWPFNRPQRSSAAEATQVFAARPRGPQAWRELPVLATSVGKPPLVAPTPPFRADLACAAPAPIVLAPLTHGRGLDAPAGLVGNVVRAAPADHDALSAPLAARRRRVEAEAEVPESVAAADPEPSAPMASAPGVNLQRAPVVARPAPAIVSFVSAASQPTLTLPPSGVFGRPASAVHAQRSPATPATPATPAKVNQHPVQPARPSAARALTPEAAPPRQSGDRLSLGQARRLGLGAPIDPVAFRVARSQPAPELRLAARVDKPTAPPSDTPSKPPVLDTTSPDALAPDQAVAASEMTASSAPSLAQSLAPPAHSRSVPRAAARSAPGLATSSVDLARPIQARARVQRAPRAAAPVQLPSLPILGARPIVPGIQRASKSARPGATIDSAKSPAIDAAGSPSSGAVRIHRSPEASDLAGALDARAFTSGTDIYLPESHGPLSGQKAQSLLAHEVTHVVQQRRFGSSLPAEDSAHGQQLEAQAVAAERGGQLPLASPPDKSNDAPRQDSPATMTWTMSGVPAAASPMAAAPPAQRAPEAKFSDPDDAFRAQLDSNEDYLFGRLERRLRRQLISERERGGTLIDAL